MLGTKVALLLNSICFSWCSFSRYFLRIGTVVHLALLLLLRLVEQTLAWLLRLVRLTNGGYFYSFCALRWSLLLGLVGFEVFLLLIFLLLEKLVVK
jgi:hypothetical protein